MSKNILASPEHFSISGMMSYEEIEKPGISLSKLNYLTEVRRPEDV
jgi:hypothetical protein